MWEIIQPPFIYFDIGAAREYHYPPNSLVITSKGAISRGWTDYMKIKNFTIFDEVKSNPSFETIEKIISQFKDENFSHVIGLGGCSSLDVAKFVAFKMEKKKILAISHTFVKEINLSFYKKLSSIKLFKIICVGPNFIQNKSKKIYPDFKLKNLDNKSALQALVPK